MEVGIVPEKVSGIRKAVKFICPECGDEMEVRVDYSIPQNLYVEDGRLTAEDENTSDNMSGEFDVACYSCGFEYAGSAYDFFDEYMDCVVPTE